MRNLKLMMLFMAVATMTLLTSCDNGDKETMEVTGTYNGQITVLTQPSDAVAELKKTNDSYSLLLEDLNISAMGNVISIGDVTIEDITIANGKLSGGEEQEIDVTLPDLLAMANGGVAEITVKVSLTNGAVLDKNLKFTLTVTDVPAFTTGVPVSFDGNKK